MIFRIVFFLLFVYLLMGCTTAEPFGIQVENHTSKPLVGMSVSFRGETYNFGAVSPGPGMKGMGGIAGPIPDEADVNWYFEDTGVIKHTYHVKIAPLPARHSNDRPREIKFSLKPDQTVKLTVNN